MAGVEGGLAPALPLAWLPRSPRRRRQTPPDMGGGAWELPPMAAIDPTPIPERPERLCQGRWGFLGVLGNRRGRAREVRGGRRHLIGAFSGGLGRHPLLSAAARPGAHCERRVRIAVCRALASSRCRRSGGPALLWGGT